MILRRRVCAAGPPEPDPEIPLPFVVDLPGGGTATLAHRKRPGDYLLTIDKSVAPTGLALVERTGSFRRGADGEDVELPKVHVTPDAVAGDYVAGDVFNALALLVSSPFSLYSSFDEPDELVPESVEDAKLLDEEFGTREVYGPLNAIIQARTFHEPVTPELVASLLPKRAGLHLYAEALRLATPSARYREFWRILESAFGAADAPLLNLLANFSPLREMGFSRAELKDLHTYRGRASHAQSRSG